MNDITTDSERAGLAPLVEAVRRGDYASAVEGLKAFLEAHPNHEIATGLLAAAYFQLGMSDRARALYERLLSLYPNNALARFQLGLLRMSDDPRESIALWAPLLDVKEEFMAHFHSALAHVQLQEHAAAAPLLEHCAQYMPMQHPLRDQLDRLRALYANDVRGYGR